MYLPGDAVLITDIGVFNAANITDPGTSLVCVTINVNTKCCRKKDGPDMIGGNVGEWYLPSGTIVARNGDVNRRDDGFARSGYTQQIRLNRRNNATSPTGMYECRVPDQANEMVSASIILG